MEVSDSSLHKLGEARMVRPGGSHWKKRFSQAAIGEQSGSSKRRKEDSTALPYLKLWEEKSGFYSSVGDRVRQGFMWVRLASNLVCGGG